MIGKCGKITTNAISQNSRRSHTHTVVEVISVYPIPVQCFPSPEKPLWQWQLYEPGVLAHFDMTC